MQFLGRRAGRPLMDGIWRVAEAARQVATGRPERVDPMNLLTPAVDWAAVDDHSFDLSMSDGRIGVSSRVFVDEQGRMVNFSTSDRWAALPGGPTRARWTTPIDGWTDHKGRWLPTAGHAIWHLDTGEFEYVHGTFIPESVEFNVPPPSILPGYG
jgi:hypothetical protein